MSRNLSLAAAAIMTLAGCVPANTPGAPDGAASQSTSSETTITSSSVSSAYSSEVASMGPPVSSSDGASSSIPNISTTDDIIFIEDFESGANGQIPSGWGSFTNYTPNLSSANQTVFVDSANARSGQKSLKVNGGANGPSQIFKALPSNLDQLYMRAWFYMSASMGNHPTDNHEHIMGTRRSENDAGQEIRVGQGKGHLGFSLVTQNPSYDAISPASGQWNSGPSTPTNGWYCVEAGFDPSQPYDELYMWVDGVEVNAVRDASDWHQNVHASWMDGLMNYAFFGWHSFSGRSTEMWIDDIVVSTQPIGCN